MSYNVPTNKQKEGGDVEDAKKQGDAFWKWFTKAYEIPKRVEPYPMKWEYRGAIAGRRDDRRGWTWLMEAYHDARWE